MATLIPKLTLTSSDALIDALNFTVTDSLAVLGAIVQKSVVTSDASAVVLAASAYTPSYVFLHNKSTAAAEIITIEKEDGGDEYMYLGAGEFAFFPWSSTVDLFADSASGTPVLEIMLFQAAA
tara:strand:+ start:294 stop:662 length:369 start_codon:yes stop_codon:yes gene_type:complete